MLVLTRKVGERIYIGDTIVVTLVRIEHDKVRLGIDAPPEVRVHREEIYRRDRDEHPRAGSSSSGASRPSGSMIEP